MSEYNDMIDLKRPQYIDFPPMSIHDRAAQFSPFAALVGYEDAVAETVRLTDRRREMSEEEIFELNTNLGKLKEMLNDRPLITVSYFIPDERKEGGRYVEKTGSVRTIDEYNNQIVFADGSKVAISDTYNIVFE